MYILNPSYAPPTYLVVRVCNYSSSTTEVLRGSADTTSSTSGQRSVVAFAALLFLIYTAWTIVLTRNMDFLLRKGTLILFSLAPLLS
jgi:hypothetical protein